MQVSQLLGALLCTPDVEVVETCLPERQAQRFLEQALLARVAGFLFRQQSMRGALLQDLHNGRRCPRLGLGDEQAEVFGHDHVSHDDEAVALAGVFENGEKAVAAAGLPKFWLVAIARASDKVQVMGAVSAMQSARHETHGTDGIATRPCKERKDGHPRPGLGTKGRATRPKAADPKQWQYNVNAGLSLLKKDYDFAVAHVPNDVARATYAHYNASGHWSEYQKYPKGVVAHHVADWMVHYKEFGGQ